MDSVTRKPLPAKGVQSFTLVIISTTFLSSVLLGIFLWRMYLRWTVKCKSENRLDGKTVLITGIYIYCLIHQVKIISLHFYKLQKLRLFIMAFKSSYVTLSYLQYQELRYFKNIA